jgi:acyl-CoA hydrolase
MTMNAVTPPLRVWYADGPDSPRLSPTRALELAGHPVDAPHEVTLGWTVERHDWLEAESFRARTVLAGYALASAVNAGRIVASPVRLSAVPTLIAEERPDVAVVSAVRRGNVLAFVDSVGWADVLARVAGRVVAEIAGGVADLGAPEIVGNIVATVARSPASGAMPTASRPADAVDLTIGRLVISLLPDEPTLQFGPGGIGEGIARSLDRPVRIWSGLVTDSMAELHDRGLLLEPIVAAYAWGGDPIRRLAAAGMLRLASCTVTHDMSTLSARERMVGCNTALQVGLDGAVNVERVNGRVIAGVGGHADFCAGASRSVGGLSIIAVRSTTASGSSTIVPRVDVVSTARSDIQVVVTEHGIADLRMISDAERARRLIAVAAPQHRDELAAAFAATTTRHGSER